MTTAFPTGLDSLSNPTDSDYEDAVGALRHPTQHANANDAIEAIQAKIGINGSADTSSLDYKVTQLLAKAVQTIVEADGSPSLPRKTLRVAGTLTDVDADTALLEWSLLQLKDSSISSYAGKAGWALQVNAAANGFEAVAPWDIESLSVPQLVIASDEPNARVTFTVNPPTPATIVLVGVPLTNSTGIGASTAEWPSTTRRHKCDLSKAIQARMAVCMGGTAFSAGTMLGVQYSTDGSTWVYLDAATGPAVDVSSSNTVVVSSWVNITALAKADVFLRLVGRGGNSATSQIVGMIELQVR